MAVYKLHTFLLYLEEIITFLRDPESHMKHINEIMGELLKAKVTIKFQKF